MRYLKMMGLLAVAAVAMMAFFGAGSASAQTVIQTTEGGASDEYTGVIESSLETGTSAILKDTAGGVNDTCNTSAVKGTVETNNNTSAGGKISKLEFGGCSHTTDVLANGELEVKQIGTGTTGTVVSKGARVTIKSTIFGLSCVANTGAGTTIGTITSAGSPTAHATMHINGVITLENGCGDSTWTGSYTVTSPTGLDIV